MDNPIKEKQNTIFDQIRRTEKIANDLKTFVFGELPKSEAAQPKSTNQLNEMLVDLTEANHVLQDIATELQAIK